MAVSAATAGQAVQAERRTVTPDKGPRTPWWLYLCVFAIVVFCLTPFYWLVNISLKTGPQLSSADIWPPDPSLDNYRSIFQNLKGISLHDADEYAPFNTGFIVYHDDIGDYSTNEPIMDGTANLTYLLGAMGSEKIESRKRKAESRNGS